MLNDVNWSQKLILIAVIVAFIFGVCLLIYRCGYTAGRDAQILKYQEEAMQIAEQVNQSAILVQQEMEKTDEKLEKASSISDECNFVLNYDLTPCGVFD